MRRLLHRLIGHRGGATAVEFAFVAPVFILMLIGGVEFGRAAWTREALQQTAIVGARCMGVLATGCAASGAYSSSSTTTYVKNVAAGFGVKLADGDISLTRSTTCAGLSNFSQVTLTYSFQTAVPVLIKTLESKSLTAKACFPNYS